ncbi:electron transport complex subunit RsxC [Arenimonas sp. MALMAid1274]|uniref:electron transport complex subunit RsxC n=1 Tax=Arenimonas sp. MALMAid1274 TaxID=3411630 RepID=UPI003BA1B787
MRLHRFHGGLRLAGHKAESTRDGLRTCTLPECLQVSLLQHAGEAALPCVAVGEVVVAGQRIGVATGEFSAHVHAPASGRVRSVSSRPVPHLPGVEALHVGIAVDAIQPAAPLALPAMDAATATPGELRERVREAGIVGLGGAGFPTAEKLSAGRELLVLNGAECEPWMACDDALLRAHAGDVLRGGLLLARAVGATRVLLAIEDRMAEALAAAHAAATALNDHESSAVEVVAVPTRYPAGGERQLIQVLTGREVPRGGLPRDLGILVHNVATARAAWRAVALGEVLVSRIVSVTGRGVADPANYVVPLGTPVSHLVTQAGGYTPAAARLLLGGPMMGQALAHDEVPIGKTQGAVLVLSSDDVADERGEMPCIRCGDCASACPSRLQPQMLLWQLRADRLDRASDQGLFDCIECGACDLVCPSHIPLTAHFRHGKSTLRLRALDAGRAQAARERHESRQQRLERESRERAERDARRASALDASSDDAVAAALARARAKRAAAADPGTPP